VGVFTYIPYDTLSVKINEKKLVYMESFSYIYYVNEIN